jgi:hypothetical protein
VLDSISQYSPVVIINGLAAILFMIGYVPFGVAMIRTPTLPRWAQSWLLWALRPICWGSGSLWFLPPRGRSRSWAVRVSAPGSRSIWIGTAAGRLIKIPSSQAGCFKIDRSKSTQFGTQDQLLADDGLLMATIDQLSDIPGRFDDLAVIQRI